MGVKDFTKVFPDVETVVKWNELRGKTIAMDAMHELWSSLTAISFNPLTDSKGNITGHIKILMNKVVKYTSFGITPVYVFDNPVATPLKDEENTKRKICRDKVKQELKTLESMKHLTEEELKRKTLLECRALTPDATMIKKFQKLLQYMGVAYFTAPPGIEGDKFCVNLQKEGYVDYILTEDKGDILAFGGSSVIYKSKKSPQTYINIIYMKDLLKKYKIDYNQFLDICIALGTDFAPKSPSIGPKTVLKRKLVLSQRQLQAKEYYQSRIPSKDKTHMYKHHTYNAKKLTKFLRDLEFGDDSIGKVLTGLKKYYDLQ